MKFHTLKIGADLLHDESVVSEQNQLFIITFGIEPDGEQGSLFVTTFELCYEIGDPQVKKGYMFNKITLPVETHPIAENILYEMSNADPEFLDKFLQPDDAPDHRIDEDHLYKAMI